MSCVLVHTKRFIKIWICCRLYRSAGIGGWQQDGGMEVNMREGIHPDYYQAKVVCNCGNEFVTGSTKEEIHVEICSKCHSFYTGQQKAVKARGAIDKFNRRYGIQSN